MWNYTDICKHIKNPKFPMPFLSFIAVIIIFQTISPCTSLISDKRLCYDPDCSEAVSIGKTTLNYNSPDPDILSFDLNDDVKVFSKSAGSRNDLWGIEIKGNRGYAPKLFIREKHVLHRDLTHTVPTELSKKLVRKSYGTKEIKDETSSTIRSHLIENDNEIVPPDIDQVSPSFEVIDGTTIYSPSETEEKENSYATKIIRQSPAIQEQPILSVHPNLKSSEISPDTASTVQTGDLSENNIDPKESINNQNTDKAKEENIDTKVSPDDKVFEKILLETSSAALEKQIEKPESEAVAIENVSTLPTNNQDNEESKKSPEKNGDINETDNDDNENIPKEVLDESKNAVQNSEHELEKESVEKESEETENNTVTSTFAEVLGKVTSYFVSPDSQPSTEEDSKQPAEEDSKPSTEEISKLSAEKDSNPSAKEDSKSSAEEDSKPSTEEIAKLSTEKDSKPSAEEDSKPSTEEISKLSTEKDSKPSAKEDSKSSAEEDSKPSTEEISKLSTEKDSKPSAKEDSKSSAEEDSKPSTEEIAKLSTEKDSKPSAKEDSKPTTEETSKLSSEEDSQKEKTTSSKESEEVSKTTLAVEAKLPEVTETSSHLVTEPKLQENQPVEVEQQVPDKKRTSSPEKTETIVEEKNMSTEAVPETILSNKTSSEQIKSTVETDSTPDKEPEKVPEPVSTLSDIIETNSQVNEALKEMEKASEITERILISELPMPSAKVKKFFHSVESEEEEILIEVPNSVMSQKPQFTIESLVDENIEEASGTTETSVQLELTDQTTEKVSESLTVDLTTQTTPKAVYSDSVVLENVNNVSKVNNVIDKDKLNDTQDIIPKTEKELTQQGQPGINEQDGLSGLNQNTFADRYLSFNELPSSRNLLNVQSEVYPDSSELIDNNKSETSFSDTTIVPEGEETTTTPSNDKIITSNTEAPHMYQKVEMKKGTELVENVEHVILPSEVCSAHNNCDESIEKKLPGEDSSTFDNEKEIIHAIEQGQNYWETLSYLTVTALTTLFFSLGYFYIEKTRRDGQLIAKINKLEKELLISTKECTALDDTLKSTETKLGSIEDESFGSNEMVTSLKTELEDANKAKADLENQVSTLEKDLESATEAGLELERMLREILATKNEENPLAKTIEDLQARLDAQQSANKSLTSALQLKTQELEIDKSENVSLRDELAVNVQKCGQLDLEVTRLSGELNLMTTTKQEIETRLTKKVEELEKHLTEIKNQHKTLKIQLKSREIEIKDLSEVVNKSDINSIDLKKLSSVSQMKAEIDQLKEERDDLKIKLTEIEGAHNLLEEHSRSINDEIMSLTDQVKIAIKEKNEAETRLEVLTKFFQEKEAERQKEENLWLQKQGEVSTTVEKMQIMQSEIQNYKQQIETLKREIFDQEKEYKTQIAALEAKSHEQWVRARQSERRLEESKAESGQLRNRLTLIEKNISDNESEAKTHRLESNGETATSPQLFLGAETSSSPLMFTGSSSIPPPPYLYGPPLPPFLSSHLPTLPGYDVGQRPPPLGRLSSPPPIPINASGPLPPPPPLHNSSNNRYDHSGSSPSPPISPPLIHPHGPYRTNSQPPPPIPPFSNDRIPPVPLPGMLPHPHLPNTSWGEDKLSSRNNGSFHPFQRDQHPREYKGSLDVSEEPMDRSRRSGKL